MVIAINSDCYLWLMFNGLAFYCVEFGYSQSSVCLLQYFDYHSIVLNWLFSEFYFSTAILCFNFTLG